MTIEAPDTSMLGCLTSRELDVLRLLADGLNNTGIAQELWLSERTVECHVTRIFDKLQLGRDNHNRRVRAALAYHGLRFSWMTS